jgi:hypothetical protein
MTAQGKHTPEASTALLEEIFKLCREHDAVSLESDKQKIAQEIIAKTKQLEALRRDGK